MIKKILIFYSKIFIIELYNILVYNNYYQWQEFYFDYE